MGAASLALLIGSNFATAATSSWGSQDVIALHPSSHAMAAVRNSRESGCCVFESLQHHAGGLQTLENQQEFCARFPPSHLCR